MKRLIFLAVMAIGLLEFSIASHVEPSEHWKVEAYRGPLSALRVSFLDHLSGVTRDAAGMVAGLAIGDKTHISAQTLDQMKVVSLTHLTAVSGANCAIVIGLIYLALRKVPISRAFRVILSAGSLLFYVLLVGPEPSVLRAATMAIVVLLAVALGRIGAATQALALAVIILLISDPLLAIDFGFQLSVLATGGILLLAPAIFERLRARMPQWLAGGLSVSAAAQIFCLPVLLELQPGLATYSIPANLVAEPLVAPITVLGMLACVLSPVAPILAVALTWLASLGAWLIIAEANWFADLPMATIDWLAGASGIVLALCVAVAFLVWLKNPHPRARLVAGIGLALILVVTCGHLVGRTFVEWPSKGWIIVSCDVGQGDATVIQSRGRFALIDVGRKPRPVRECLNRLHVKHLDLLVLTHFDMDHVGGLDGALSGRTVGSAMITAYHDERPAAAITWRKLRRVAPVVEAYRGMNGSLGDFQWQVLSPHAGAAEAEDSNDGSVTMLFSKADLVLLALADLGERGQMRLASESSGWLGNGFGSTPVIVKVAHHGSADQYPELYEALHPTVALFSVGAHNDYGHPTKRTLSLLNRVGASSFRTDFSGGVAVVETSSGLRVITERGG